MPREQLRLLADDVGRLLNAGTPSAADDEGLRQRAKVLRLMSAQVPALGETLARRIVDSRLEDGAYADHEDLLRVQGIGPRTLERMKPYLRPTA